MAKVTCYFQSQKREEKEMLIFFLGVNICMGKKDYDVVHLNPICFNFSPFFSFKSCLTKRFE